MIHFNYKLAACVSASVWMCSGQVASAQSTTPPAVREEAPVNEGFVLEQIVVTAQKRSERLSDVPLSITAASGDQLERHGITDTSQLEKIVPGFTYQQSTYGVPVFTMRGVGFFETTLGVSPTVSVYVDQIALPFSAMARGATLDLERVEALKGPQGTLFGQNSTGGAINYIAVKPTDTLEIGTSLSYARFDAVDVEGFVSGPLSETLSMRVAGRAERRGDWQESQTRDDSLGQKRFDNGRILLDWNPSDAARVELNLSGWRDRSDTQAAQFRGFAPLAPGYQPAIDALADYPVGGDDARVADWDAHRNYSRDDEFYLIGLRGDWDITDDLTLTSLTAYSNYEARAPSDVEGTDYTDLYVTIDGELESFSQELRLAGASGERLRWMIGANYQRDTADEHFTTVTGTTVSAIGPFRFDRIFIINNQDITTRAVFGSFDFGLTDTLTAQLSARYTTQDRDFEGCAADAGNGQLAAAIGLLSSLAMGTFPVMNPVAPGSCVTLSSAPATFGQPLPIVTDALDEDNVSWRASLNWKPNQDILLYANVTEGYKAGAFPTLAGAFDVQFTPVPQERLISYEAGVKTSLLNGTAQVNAAVYYYDYSDKQVLGFGIVPGFGNLPQLVSIPKSKVQGAELEVTVLPVTGLTVSAGVAYVDSEVREDPANPTTAFGATGVTFVGEQFPNTPEWQVVADAEYEIPVTDAWLFFVGGNTQYRSNSFAGFGADPELRIDSYTLLDLRVGVRSDDRHWRWEVWGRNVTDEYYWNNAAHLGDTVTRLTGMPRIYGATVTYRFK